MVYKIKMFVALAILVCLSGGLAIEVSRLYPSIMGGFLAGLIGSVCGTIFGYLWTKWEKQNVNSKKSSGNI